MYSEILRELKDVVSILKLDKQGYIQHYEDKYNEKYPYEGKEEWWAARSGEVSAMVDLAAMKMEYAIENYSI